MKGSTNQICISCGESKICQYSGGTQCQNCYRIEKRRERGLRPRGPKPDPTKPSSRYNSASTHHAWKDRVAHEVEPPELPRKFVQLGEYCTKGHLLTEDNTKTHSHADGRVRLRCMDCQFERGLWRKFQMSPDQFQKMLERQEGVCDICRKPFTETPHVDHDHSTGVVRGLLCMYCNQGLGRFRDDPELLRAAIEYLETTRRPRKRVVKRVGLSPLRNSASSGEHHLSDSLLSKAGF